MNMCIYSVDNCDRNYRKDMNVYYVANTQFENPLLSSVDILGQ